MNLIRPSIVAVLAVSISQLASAQEITNRFDLNSLLGSNQTVEGFEGYSLPDNSTELLLDPTGNLVLDNSSVYNGQGPGLVADGAVYQSGAGGLEWAGDGWDGGTTRHVRLPGSDDQRISYVQPVQAMGFDVMFLGFPHTFDMDVYNTNGVLVGSVSRFIPSISGTREFVGFQHAAGIGFVDFRNSFADTGIRLDDHGYGHGVALQRRQLRHDPCCV